MKRPRFTTIKHEGKRKENAALVDRVGISKRRGIFAAVIAFALTYCGLYGYVALSAMTADFRPLPWRPPAENAALAPVPSKSNLKNSKPRCAIIFWGLPRAFESLVLPTIVENVLKPNSAYECDFFVHYYHLTQEGSGRSGQGGKINPEDILKLKQSILKAMPPVQANHPQVSFAVTKEEDFWKQYDHLLQKIHDTKDESGNYLYLPWNDKTYKTQYAPVDNIVKMWHSIQESWNLMQAHADDHKIAYDRVAMLRSDVMYMTPVDIFEIHSQVKDTENKVAVVPGFGKYPVSDRIIYGPYDAVKVWATQRFARIDRHVRDTAFQQHSPGYGMHSERFMNWTIFPAIRNEVGVEIVEHESLCFFRARADETVWITDCGGRADAASPTIVKKLTAKMPVKALVQRILQRKCGNVTRVRRSPHRALNCSSSLAMAVK